MMPNNTSAVDADIPRPAGPLDEFDVALPDGTLEKMCEWAAQYGDMYAMYAPDRKSYVYVLNHPDLARHVLATNYRNYTKGIGIDRVKILLGNGLMVSEGDFWKSQRKLIQPSFHRQVLENFTAHIQRCTQDLLTQWRQAKEGLIDVTRDMSDVTLRFVLDALFSEDLDALIAERGENPFAMVAEETNRDLNFARNFRQLTTLVSVIMKDRRENNRLPHDFLSMLMEAKDKQTGERMPDKQLVNEIMTLIVAGHETTASSLNWTWYLLSQHPEVEAKLHAEVDAVLQGEFPDLTVLEQLPYTRQVIQESLRLYPPGWMLARRSIGADEIAGYPIPPKTDVLIAPYILQRHPDFWEDPEAFNPERFTPTASEGRHQFAYFPFSAGPRNCIGDTLAMTEMHLHLATMAQHFRLEYVPDKPIELEPQINLRTKHSLTMRLHPRR